MSGKTTQRPVPLMRSMACGSGLHHCCKAVNTCKCPCHNPARGKNQRDEHGTLKPEEER